MWAAPVGGPKCSRGCVFVAPWAQQARWGCVSERSKAQKIRQPQQACQNLSMQSSSSSLKFLVPLGGRFQEGGGAILALEVSWSETCRRQAGKTQGPRSRPEGPKTPQDASKTPQDGPRRP